jgi:triacylglycerol lipase
MSNDPGNITLRLGREAGPIRLDPSATPAANALALARLAWLAYSEPEAFHEAPLNPDWAALHDAFPMLRVFEEERVQGFVAGNDADIVIAFAGTSRHEDWWDSLSAMQVSAFGGRAHKGFAMLLDRVWTRILAALYDLDGAERRIWLTGHSLGGALATLAAARLQHEGFDPQLTVTFGAPPVFDERAAGAFKPKLLRVVNDGDWVPGLQWPRLGSPYSHVGQELCLLRSGALANNRYPQHLQSRLDRIDRYLEVDRDRLYGDPISDHAIGEYAARLARC